MSPPANFSSSSVHCGVDDWGFADCFSNIAAISAADTWSGMAPYLATSGELRLGESHVELHDELPAERSDGPM